MTNARSSSMCGCLRNTALPAGIGTELHLAPVLRPALAPHHRPAAGNAQLAGERRLVAFERCHCTASRLYWIDALFSIIEAGVTWICPHFLQLHESITGQFGLQLRTLALSARWRGNETEPADGKAAQPQVRQVRQVRQVMQVMQARIRGRACGSSLRGPSVAARRSAARHVAVSGQALVNIPPRAARLSQAGHGAHAPLGKSLSASRSPAVPT